MNSTPRSISFPFLARLLAMVLAIVSIGFFQKSLFAQKQEIVWSDQEKPLLDTIRTLRKLPDSTRAGTTKQLALQIRELPETPNKLRLADYLASLATEGDLGHDTLQEVATTLAATVKARPVPDLKGQPAEPYVELASLVKYEHVSVSLDAAPLKAAMAKLESDDQQRQQADFTLTDLNGKLWTLKNLQGKVVLVNFWATWCPPCRKEMPDLEKLYEELKDKGFVILAISDEEAAKVTPFIAAQKVTYPVMLDPGRKVNELFQVAGIPRSFLYDRDGKLVTESIDMRTERQFRAMLEMAGLK